MKISVSRSHILVTVYRKVFHVGSGYPRYVSVNTNYTYTTIIEYTPWSYQVGLSLKVQSHFPYLELDIGKWIELKFESFVVSLNIIASSLLFCPCTSDVHPNDNIRINACSFQWRWWQDFQHVLMVFYQNSNRNSVSNWVYLVRQIQLIRLILAMDCFSPINSSNVAI